MPDLADTWQPPSRDAAADLDKDGQTSLLEAYLTACRRVKEFYDGESRLMTEHALLDDNGDSRGTPAEWFRGARAVKRAADGAELDGLHARQLHLVASDLENQMPREVRQQRDQLERQVAALRERKHQLSADEYYSQLEQLMLPLARIYETAEVQGAEATVAPNVLLLCVDDLKPALGCYGDLAAKSPKHRSTRGPRDSLQHGLCKPGRPARRRATLC